LRFPLRVPPLWVRPKPGISPAPIKARAPTPSPIPCPCSARPRQAWPQGGAPICGHTFRIFSLSPFPPRCNVWLAPYRAPPRHPKAEPSHAPKCGGAAKAWRFRIVQSCSTDGGKPMFTRAVVFPENFSAPVFPSRKHLSQAGVFFHPECFSSFSDHGPVIESKLRLPQPQIDTLFPPPHSTRPGFSPHLFPRLKTDPFRSAPPSFPFFSLFVPPPPPRNNGGWLYLRVPQRSWLELRKGPLKHAALRATGATVFIGAHNFFTPPRGNWPLAMPPPFACPCSLRGRRPAFFAPSRQPQSAG